MAVGWYEAVRWAGYGRGKVSAQGQRMALHFEIGRGTGF